MHLRLTVSLTLCKSVYEIFEDPCVYTQQIPGMNSYAYERAAKHNNIPTEGEYIIKDLCLSRCKRSSNKHYVENSVAHKKKKQYKVIRVEFIHKVIQINLHSFIHSFQYCGAHGMLRTMEYVYLHMGECQMCQMCQYKVIQMKFTAEIMQSHSIKIYK